MSYNRGCADEANRDERSYLGTAAVEHFAIKFNHISFIKYLLHPFAQSNRLLRHCPYLSDTSVTPLSRLQLI